MNNIQELSDELEEEYGWIINPDDDIMVRYVRSRIDPASQNGAGRKKSWRRMAHQMYIDHFMFTGEIWEQILEYRLAQ